MMNLELFRFVKHSAATSSPSSPLGSDNMDVANSGDSTTLRNEDPVNPPLKRRCFSSKWSEGHVWLKHDRDNDVMFCKWCRRFNRNEYRNHFVKGCALMKVESIKKHKL